MIYLSFESDIHFYSHICTLKHDLYLGRSGECWHSSPCPQTCCLIEFLMRLYKLLDQIMCEYQCMMILHCSHAGVRLNDLCE